MSGILKVTDLLDGQRRGVLFLCGANSARSQMAEGFARFLGPSDIEIFSAGSEATRVHPSAVQAMREVGIDITTQTSKAIDSVPLSRVAVAITLCEDRCPVVPKGIKKIHWPLADPATDSISSDDERLSEFRRVRDQIRELVSSLF